MGKRLSAYAVAHFLVDFGCAFLLFRLLKGAGDWQIRLLLYNFCAFGLQMPIGLLADRVNRNGLCAALGCLLVAAAYGTALLTGMGAVLAGVGNAMFHVGGGIDVLNQSEKRASALGVFVSPGAFGIYFGTLAGKGEGLPVPAAVLVLLGAAALLALLCGRREAGWSNRPVSLELPAGAMGAAVCLFLVVCLRSWVGMNQSFAWKGEWHWALILVCALVAGKAAGGFLSDWLGPERAAVCSLGSAAVCYLLSGLPGFGVAAVFLFQMTMPITLWAMAKLFPGCKGFSFGLLTFSLFLGFLPSWLGVSLPVSGGWVWCAASLLSLGLLLWGLRKR